MKYFFSILLTLTIITGSAQNLKKFYLQSLHPQGLLYFVYPQKMSEIKDEKKVSRAPLSYDYTYLDSRDSVRLLTTTITERTFKADSLSISLPTGERKTYASELIYCKPVGKGWECRTCTNISNSDWILMYSMPDPFTITLFSAENNLRPAFSDKKSRWKELSKKFSTLHEIIKLNRKKD